MRGCNGIGTPMLEADRDKIVSTHTELLDANKKRFQQAFGCLLYLMHRTRSNLSFALLNIAQSLQNTIWMLSKSALIFAGYLSGHFKPWLFFCGGFAWLF